jgi:probable rRNA maturation factor
MPLNLQRIKTLIEAVLRHEKVQGSDLTFNFVTRQKIQALNKRYLRHNYATDVIAFDLSAGYPKPRHMKVLQGEIFISADAAMKNAAEYGSTEPEEFFLYIVHGILHLLGYDDHTTGDVKKMRAKEAEIMNYIGKKAHKILLSS